MSKKHYLEVTVATGQIEGENELDPTFYPLPEAPAGRLWVDVTEEGRRLGELSAAGYRYVDGALVAPTSVPRPPVIDRKEFIRRFTPAEWQALQAAGADPEVAHAAALVQSESTVDLGDADTVAYLDLLVTKNIVSRAVADRVLVAPGR